VGDPTFQVLGINEIHVVEKGDVVFVDHPKYYDKALKSKASVVLINKEVDCPDEKALLISDDPFRDFNKLTEHFNPFKVASKSIADTVEIGKGTVVQPNVFIGNHVKIGKNCTIHPNVTIYDQCIIGNNVTIHAGTILGADAFYYKNRPEGYDKLRSGGRVIIEDNVDIGAACTIDRGVSGDTIIGAGSKLDNQIQVGHDTVIGKKCLIASQTGIAGCVVIEDEVVIWGQVGIASGLRIGKKAIILAQAGIAKSLEGGKSYFGYPAEEAREKLKQLANLRKIPEIIKKIDM
jgi:UDP-3-O-[3-hydroxymyristoyl] glucosamine N-acyltransferase